MKEHKIDLYTVIRELSLSILNSVDFCYPKSYLDEDRCHGQLQMIKADAQALLSVINNVEAVK